MPSLQEIVDYCDERLNLTAITDFKGAENGIQFQNNGTVTKVGAAVDAGLVPFQKAVEANVDLLIVHHGMFWQGAQPLTGAFYQKTKLAFEAGMALYSAHIPLDVHPVWGNNKQLANAIGMDDAEPFFDWKGIQLGMCQKMDLSLADLTSSIEHAVGGPVHVCAGGTDQAGKVGIITGGAGSEVAAVAASGIDTFITGEGPHWSFPMAEELGINLIYAGHYATETFGVRVLAEHLEQKFGTNVCFLDHPTGL